MKTLKDYAIQAFRDGGDNFGEIATGETCPLKYNKMVKGYMMTVMLIGYPKTPEEHSCTSGIGFYPRNGRLHVMSGHWMIWSIEITPEIQAELDNAIIEEY